MSVYPPIILKDCWIEIFKLLSFKWHKICHPKKSNILSAAVSEATF